MSERMDVFPCRVRDSVPVPPRPGSRDYSFLPSLWSLVLRFPVSPTTPVPDPGSLDSPVPQWVCKLGIVKSSPYTTP